MLRAKRFFNFARKFSIQVRPLIFTLILIFLVQSASAQRFLTDVMDTTTAKGRKIYSIFGDQDKLRFSGYLQPQFQYAQSKGVANYSGGDFAPFSDNRFTIRRGRLRIDYAHFNALHQPVAMFVFQFDGSERGFFTRDFWGRFYENKLQLFNVTTGLFARPMGFEVNLGSGDRESPERGRMSQILMKVERDLGAMVSFESRREKPILPWLKVDLGVFNGQGLIGTTDYDSHKDIIGRAALKPQTLGRSKWVLSGGASAYYGAITNQSSLYYEVSGTGANARFIKDSSQSNVGYAAPRRYYGADAQLRIPNKKGFTELRGEFITGQQTGTANSSETPGTYPVSSTNVLQPLFTRSFNGAYFYFLQHLGTEKMQLVLKYDWYDPNTAVKGREIAATQGFSAGDVRYDTYGGGLVYYFDPNLKATAYYEYIVNESTNIKGYTEDIKDNIFTLRLQYRF